MSDTESSETIIQIQKKIIPLLDDMYDDTLPEIRSLLSPLLRHQRKTVISEKCVTEDFSIQQFPHNTQTIFFKACINSSLNIVRYFIEECEADLEQPCPYSVFSHHSVHIVPPLWLASINCDRELAELLIEYGASVNGMSDTNSTALRAACFSCDLDMVKFLVSKGADVNIPNLYGCTCLMNAVQDTNIVEFLIQNGANINAKESKKSKLTAIHYAVHNNNIDALKLIAQAGADLTALDKDGNQPIVSAALFGQTEMVEYLVNYNKTLKEDVVKVYELLAVFEIENENFDSGLAYLRKALGVKEQYFLCQKEPNMEELQNLLHYFFVPKIKTDVDILPRDKGSLHAVSVLIKSRYFSILNNEILFSLLEYATCIKNEEAFRVFSFVHNKFLEKRKCLHENAIYAVSSAIRSIEKTIKDEVPLDRKYIITNLRELFHHLVHQISECIKDDRFKKKKEKIINFQLLIGHSLCIINLMLKHDYKTFPNISKLFADDVRRLINVNPRFSRGDTMLHVMMSNTDVFEEENRVNQSFPKMDKLIIEYLLLQGLDPDCRNAQGETALHLLMSQNDTMEDDEVVKDILILLLEQGAHIDVRDDNDRTPLAMIRQKGIQIPEVNFRSLKCYAANVIADMGIQYKTILPLTLLPFVELHKSVDM